MARSRVGNSKSESYVDSGRLNVMTRFKQLSLALLVIFFLVLAVLIYGKQPQPFPEGSMSSTILTSGPYAVASYREQLVDFTRSTQANGDAMAIDGRLFDTVIWYPSEKSIVAAGQHPLVIFSHGFFSNKMGGSHLGAFLASHGYIVVSADYPLTNMYSAGGAMVQDVANQPADVSFLIDTLLQWSQTEGHLFNNTIDSLRIAAIGVSLGGMTTTLAAFHPEKRDPRIKIAASIAGPMTMFGAKFFARHDMPFLMLASDQDVVINYQANAREVLERVSGAKLVTISGASHTGFSGLATHLRWLNNPDSIGCALVLSSIDIAEDEPWHDLLGTPEQGIIQDPGPALCTAQSLPEAMNVLRQHKLTKVIVFSFFQSYFAENSEKRAFYAGYLRSEMAEELSEVRYEEALNTP